MKVSYYPGCSLGGTAREYGESTDAICDSLDIELDELNDWNCCGASSALSSNDSLSIALSERNLTIAEKHGHQDLIVPCVACYQRLKTAEMTLADSSQTIAKTAYQGTLNIKHLLDFLHDNTYFEKIKTKIKKPLSGLKTVCYYGCLMVRPPKVTGADNYEDPQNLDQLMMVLGADNLCWSYKTDCCGGSLFLTHSQIVTKLTSKLLEMAKEAGADTIVTGCPLCQGNLDIRQKEMTLASGKEHFLPVFYFTELIGLAMGHPDVSKWLERHLIDPIELLNTKGLV